MEELGKERGRLKRTPISSLKGIGTKTAELYNRLGIETVEELLTYYPRDYDIYKEPVQINSVSEGGIAAVEGMVVKTPDRKVVRNLQIITTTIRDESGSLALTWYNMAFLVKTLRPGSRYVFRGKVQRKNGRLVMEQPEMFTLGQYDSMIQVMQPIYGLTAGLSNKAVIKAVKQALEHKPVYPEYLPKKVREEHQLAEFNFVFDQIHFPKNMEEYTLARRRVVFEEFFTFILALRMLKEENEETKNQYSMVPVKETEDLLSSLPYELTNAQKNVWKEIQKDLQGSRAMNRLIQGDVGSGKTIIAILALLETACHGYQGALMVPTEVLATQHYESITDLFSKYGIKKKVVLLTGSMTAKEKRIVYEEIASHEADIVIGTHALIQEKVVYDRLALVITDEQHRFGVRQREMLAYKGEDRLESEKGKEKENNAAHVLVMSATPIPRTLAIIVYGDLDISVIDELPANRLPIKNCVVDTSYRQKAYAFMEKEVRKGRQVYVICPMVEESEQIEAENVMDYTSVLRENLSSDIRIEYLHGKMKAKEKNFIMEQFAVNKIQILVSTTVIEVGVNVPNATVMMVENAERFGLAQLHQLRGRVGRGKEQSYCIFVTGLNSKDIRKRLEILNQSNDGFFIASEDLKLRGPGDFFGVRQSGIMEFKMGDIYTDAGILKEAADAAKRLLKEDPYLENEENVRLREYMEEYVMNRLARINL